jgi:hypothetical protein
MIQFTVFTETQVAADPPDTFPLLIYILTDFSEINDLAGQTENFIGNHYISLFSCSQYCSMAFFHFFYMFINYFIHADVLGVVTDVQPLRQASERNTTVIRDIIIKNIK